MWKQACVNVTWDILDQTAQTHLVRLSIIAQVSVLSFPQTEKKLLSSVKFRVRLG